MKLQKTTKRCPLGLAACFGVLGLLAIAMLCPVAPKTAKADEGDAVTEEASSIVRAMVRPVLAIALGDVIDVDVVPRADGNGYSANSMNLTVNTNNTSGFEVFIRGVDGNEDGNTELKSKTSTSVINSTTSTVPLKNLSANTWGVYFGSAAPTEDSDFQPVTTDNTSLDKVNEANISNQYVIGFGTKVDTVLPAGTYSNSVIVSVVANPLEVSSLSDLYFMQDMTPEVCSVSLDGETAYVTDQRDGNKYWIAKLRDGRCWMTQNLDLNITADGFTSADTNISAGAPNNGVWNQTSTYKPTATSTTVPSAQSNPSQTATYSWDFGKWVLATPLETTNCGDVTSIATCTKVGFVDVSGADWKPTFDANADGRNKTFNGKTYALVAVDEANKTYDPHYLIGNYYQYNTATAGSGGTITNADAVSSICPKGWQLPTAGTQANATNGSFYNMLIGYGLQSTVSSGAITSATMVGAGNVKQPDGSTKGYDVTAGEYNIADAPLYYVRSGYVNISMGKFRAAGINGYGWSARADSTATSSFVLAFNASVVYPSYSYNRWSGFPLRCLSTV